MPAPSASLLASIFSAGPLGQRARLLRVAVSGEPIQASDPSGRRAPVQWVLESLHAQEALSQDFCFTLTLLADSAAVALKDMLGRVVVASLVRPDGSLRHFCGHVFEFALVGSDAGIATYRAVLRPWLHHLSLRVNNRVFLGQNLQQQSSAILEDHSPLPRWQWSVQGEDAPFTMACQGGGVGESDWNYLHRRWEAAGYSYHWEHTPDAHTLVIGDDSSTQSEPIDGESADIRFQSEGGAQEEDAIARWRPVRQMASGQWAASAFDFKRPQPRHSAVPTLNRQGEVPQLEVHEDTGAYGFRKEDAAGDALVRRRMEEIEARAKFFDGSGNNRFMQPGRWFRLSDHPDASPGPEGEFLILSTTHEASNNYLQGEGAKSTYSNTFVASRRGIPWRPGRGHASTPVQVLAPQTATVVGPAGAGSLNTDEYGRIQIQYHWDREGRHSAWVRVSSSWAGGETGSLTIPRVGSEVIVQHLNADADHPIVTGVVWNQQRMPNWHLPEQKSLSGLRSRELSGDGGNSPGGRSNHLILDDTPGRIQVQLKSDHQASQLSLGHIARIEDTQGRKDARGQGFELRTDGHGALRAQDGLLITTEARPNAGAHLTDMGETIARLTAARDQHEGLSEAAMQAKAHEAGDSDEVAKTLKAQDAAIKGQGGSKESNQFPELSEPHLTIASPAGIQTTTAGSTHQASNEHHAITSGQNTSISAGRSFIAAAKEAVRVFAYKSGIRLVAAGADVEFAALKTSIDVLAKMTIRMEANKISITAKESVTVNGGTSFTTWDQSGIVHGTAGLWREHAAYHSLVGPDSKPVIDPQFAQAVLNEKKQKLKVIDALGNGVVPDSHAIVRPGLSQEKTSIQAGEIDPDKVMRDFAVRRWSSRKG